MRKTSKSLRSSRYHSPRLWNLVLLCRRHHVLWHRGRLTLEDLHVPWLRTLLQAHAPPLKAHAPPLHAHAPPLVA